MGDGLHDGADDEPVAIDLRLEAERAQPGRDVLERRRAPLHRRRDRLLERGEPVVLVEADRAERRERRVEEPEVVVTDDHEPRARDRLAGRRVDDAAEREIPLERLAVGAEPDGDAERRQLAGGDLVQPFPGDLPDDGVFAFHLPRGAQVTSKPRGWRRLLAGEHRRPLLAERAERLDAVPRAEAVLVEPVLEGERLLERQVEAAVDRALRLPERDGRVPRDLLGERRAPPP